MKMTSLAYLAGLVGSDGHLERSRPYVYVYTKNEKFKDFIVETLKAQTKTKVSCKFRKRVFQIRVWSRELHELLQKSYSIDIGKKSDKLVSPKLLTLAEQLEYLKAFLDGDSSVFREVKKEKRKTKVATYSYPAIELKIKSKEIAEWSRLLLEFLGLKISKVYERDGAFYWRIRGARMVTKFKQVLGFSHPDKKETLEKLVKEFDGFYFSKRLN